MPEGAEQDVCPDCGNSVEPAGMEGHRAEVHGEKDPAKRARWPWLVSVLFVVVVVAAVLIRSADPETIEINADGEPYWGDPEAPAVFLYSDYQCHDCGTYTADGRFASFMSKWVETGNVRLVSKNLVREGEDSQRAAEASQAVWELAPEAWPEWHRLLFENQRAEDGWASQEALVAMAEGFGRFDVAEFSSALEGRSYRGEVVQDSQEAQRNGITEAPRFWIDGEAYRVDDPALGQAIDQLTG